MRDKDRACHGNWCREVPTSKGTGSSGGRHRPHIAFLNTDTVPHAGTAGGVPGTPSSHQTPVPGKRPHWSGRHSSSQSPDSRESCGLALMNHRFQAVRVGARRNGVLSARTEGCHIAGLTWRRGIAVNSQTHGTAHLRDHPGLWSLSPIPRGWPVAHDHAEGPPAVGRGSHIKGTSSRVGTWGADTKLQRQGPGPLRKKAAAR